MTPTEHQRILFEHRAPEPRKGLDRLADELLGRAKRGPWATARLAAEGREIAAERESLSEVSDHQLNEYLSELGGLRRRKPLDWRASLVPGLAALAVAAERELGLKAYEVQLMAASALIQGFFTEVDTGEGKTLAIGLAAAFQAWSGLPCHVITANDYLAGRDAKNLRAFYQRVGLTVGAVLAEDDDEKRRTGYDCGITYTTAKEAAADYLRDGLRSAGVDLRPTRLLSVMSGKKGGTGPVHRGLHAALIDEADHALIDEAVTPLIISRTLDAGEMQQMADAAWRLVSDFECDIHYRPDRVRRSCELLAPGVEQVLQHLDLPHAGLWANQRRRLELVRQAVDAREFFLRDEQYVVDDGKVVIVDPATGRPMAMRTWQQGLHQIIEAKEGLTVTGATETLARISFQRYFRKYTALAGASGTLREAAGELWHTYHAPFVRVPRNLPCQRYYAGIRFCASPREQQAALLHEIKTRHARGQPLLIGARTVEASEQVAELLRGERFTRCDQVLNAVRHREEALLVSRAGQRGGITIATSMAGRGTDIKLENGVDLLGGLHVVATEANESARVDRQLFGRAARQGDPGSVISIYCAEDAVLKRFIPTPLLRVWTHSLGWKFLGELPQWLGRGLLGWSHWRAQALAARSRHRVMLSEVDIQRSLGFTIGRGRGSSG
jgi:preprotein translocase subunit SecA